MYEKQITSIEGKKLAEMTKEELIQGIHKLEEHYQSILKLRNIRVEFWRDLAKLKMEY